MTKTLPDPPAPVVRPAEYGFGDDVAGVEERLVGGVDQALRARFGKPVESYLAAPAGTDFTALRGWYDQQAAGWQKLSEAERAVPPAQGGGFGYGHDDQAFVLLWLDRTSPDGSRPVTILRYGTTR